MNVPQLCGGNAFGTADWIIIVEPCLTGTKPSGRHTYCDFVPEHSLHYVGSFTISVKSLLANVGFGYPDHDLNQEDMDSNTHLSRGVLYQMEAHRLQFTKNGGCVLIASHSPLDH